MMSEDCWREILIDVEPRGKEFRLGIERDAVVSDILGVIRDRCKEEGVELEKWARSAVGDDFQFVMLRKAEGNAVLAPGMTLGEVDPEICNNEKFKLGAQPVVGGLPPKIFNRRIDVLIEDFYASSLAQVYEREGWSYLPPTRTGQEWRHSLVSVRVVDAHPDGAYQTLRVELTGIPGVVALDGVTPRVGWNHTYEFGLPRRYPSDLKIDIINRTPLVHPRFRGTGKNACYNVNGEVDRIIVDLIYNTMLRPDLVRPPSLYPDEDWGVNRSSMKWYIEAGPKRVYESLRKQLAARLSGQATAGADASPRVTILDSAARRGGRKVRIVGD